jgi:hypothetical protein
MRRTKPAAGGCARARGLALALAIAPAACGGAPARPRDPVKAPLTRRYRHHRVPVRSAVGVVRGGEVEVTISSEPLTCENVEARPDPDHYHHGEYFLTLGFETELDPDGVDRYVFDGDARFEGPGGTCGAGERCWSRRTIGAVASATFDGRGAGQLVFGRGDGGAPTFLGRIDVVGCGRRPPRDPTWTIPAAPPPQSNVYYRIAGRPFPVATVVIDAPTGEIAISSDRVTCVRYPPQTGLERLEPHGGVVLTLRPDPDTVGVYLAKLRGPFRHGGGSGYLRFHGAPTTFPASGKTMTVEMWGGGNLDDYYLWFHGTVEATICR